MKVIWFDLDGTIADLYGVENWEPKLRAYDPSPYIEAEVMHNMSLLARYLNKLQKMGYRIGIISWLSKQSPKEYSKAVTAAKRQWLHNHLRSVTFDYIHITSYGFPKERFITSITDILFDDNAEVREAWTGIAYEPDKILSVLKELIDRG